MATVGFRAIFWLLAFPSCELLTTLNARQRHHSDAALSEPAFVDSRHYRQLSQMLWARCACPTGSRVLSRQVERAMQRTMTAAAKDDEIGLAIASRLAPADDVMDLQLIAPATVLAFPPVAPEDLDFEILVVLAIEPSPISPLVTHADRRSSRRNCCCSDAGRKQKNRRMDSSSWPGWSLSRLAPAKKSAQIISRQ